MKCKDIMTQNPVCLKTTDSVQRAAMQMKNERICSVLVCEDENKLVGIVTDRDIVLKVVADGNDATILRIENVMSRDPVSCNPEDDVQKAIDLMERKQIRRIPIVDAEQNFLGIISQGDIATRNGDSQTTGNLVEQISQ